ncbi:hypothetical protein DelCs14_3371 [Delftia sp. Cs1-4]|nr:hypothetical protein DelCs14_3371 [Delftia sp. Cs1-4]
MSQVTPPALRPQASWTTGSDDSGFHRPGARQSGEVPVLAHVELCPGTGPHEGLQPLRRHARLPGGWAGCRSRRRPDGSAAGEGRSIPAVRCPLGAPHWPAPGRRASHEHRPHCRRHAPRPPGQDSQAAHRGNRRTSGAAGRDPGVQSPGQSGHRAAACERGGSAADKEHTPRPLRRRSGCRRHSKAQFQFRDLRATAATTVDDDGGIRHAQALLGHPTEGMTAQYIRHKVGKKVRPVR